MWQGERRHRIELRRSHDLAPLADDDRDVGFGAMIAAGTDLVLEVDELSLRAHLFAAFAEDQSTVIIIREMPADHLVFAGSSHGAGLPRLSAQCELRYWGVMQALSVFEAESCDGEVGHLTAIQDPKPLTRNENGCVQAVPGAGVHSEAGDPRPWRLQQGVSVMFPWVSGGGIGLPLDERDGELGVSKRSGNSFLGPVFRTPVKHRIEHC